MPRTFALLLLAALAAPAVAGSTVYRTVTPDGRVIFSDRPQSKDAERIELAPLQTYSPPPLPASPRGAARPAVPARGYQRLAIMAPVADAVLRDNTGTVTVSVAIAPALERGHRLEVLLDGRPAGTGSSLTLRDVDRGSHTVVAVVRDAAGKVVARSDPVTFHVKRQFVRPANKKPS